MERQVYNISYNGLDKENRIDCLAEIRRAQNPPGSTCLDLDDLRKGSRSTKKDADAVKEPRIPGKFVRIGKINFGDDDIEIHSEVQGPVLKKTMKN